MLTALPPSPEQTGFRVGQVLDAFGLRKSNAILRTYGLVIALIILVSLITIGDPAFLSPTNLANVLGQWAPAGIMAVSTTYVILGRGFDLSIANDDGAIFDVRATNGNDPRIANHERSTRRHHALLRGGISDLLGQCGYGTNKY